MKSWIAAIQVNFRSQIHSALKILCILLLMVSSRHCLASENTPNKKYCEVLVLNSYHSGYKWSDDILKEIRTHIFKEFHGSRVFVEFLDTKNFPDKKHLPGKFLEIEEKYKNTTIDLIIVSDNNALDFLLKYRNRLHPEAPVVFCGINFYAPSQLNDTKNITGIVEIPDIKGNIDLILSLHRDVKKIVFVADPDNATGKLCLEQLESIRSEIESRIQISIWEGKTITEDLEMVRNLKSDTVVMSIGNSYYKDRTLVDFVEQGKLLSNASSVPMYGLWDFFLWTGVTGGLMINGTDQGTAASKLAVKILNGTSADSLKVQTKSPASHMFDYKSLLRFDIPLSSLPEGSIVVNKPYSLYEDLWETIWTVIFTICVLLLLVFVLILNIRKRISAENQLREYQKSLEQKVIIKSENLEQAITEVKILSGLLPICSFCKKIRDDKGSWNPIESYIDKNSDARFSHSLCSDCATKEYPDIKLDL